MTIERGVDGGERKVPGHFQGVIWCLVDGGAISSSVQWRFSWWTSVCGVWCLATPQCCRREQAEGAHNPAPEEAFQIPGGLDERRIEAT